MLATLIKLEHLELMCYKIDVFVLLGFQWLPLVFHDTRSYHVLFLILLWFFPPLRYPNGLAFSLLPTMNIVTISSLWVGCLTSGRTKDTVFWGKTFSISASSYGSITEGKGYFPTKYVEILVDK